MDSSAASVIEESVDVTPSAKTPLVAVPTPLRATPPRSKKAARIGVMSAVLVCDALVLSTVFFIADLIRLDGFLHDQTAIMLCVLLPVYAGTAVNSSAYSVNAVLSGRIGAYRAAVSLLFAVAAVALIVFFLKVNVNFSRFVFGFASIVGLVMLPLSRLVTAGLARRILGGNPSADILICDDMKINHPPGMHVIDARAFGLTAEINDPAMMDRLGRLLKNADRVFVACRPDNREAWALALKGGGVVVQVLAPELDAIGPLALDKFNGQTTLQVAVGPLRVIDRMLKRTLDIAVVMVAIPLLLPIMTIVALAIRFETPGPIFFVQRRIGQGNRLFSLYKFRSMRFDRCDTVGAMSTLRADDRVTRVGRFIRATSIDELPQLINVLLGNMSIVGPRPHATGSTAEDRLFWDIDARYWHRHAMKPGLTGLAQIRGHRGATNFKSDLTDRLQADLEYLSGWSVWRDIAIILYTLRVLVHRNAF